MNNDPAALRSKRDELWGRDRRPKEVEIGKAEGISAGLKAKEARLGDQIKGGEEAGRKRERGNGLEKWGDYSSYNKRRRNE